MKGNGTAYRYHNGLLWTCGRKKKNRRGLPLSSWTVKVVVLQDEISCTSLFESRRKS